MKTRIARIALLVLSLFLTQCGNFLHDLIPITRERDDPSRPVSPPLILVIDGSSGSFIIPATNIWSYDWTIDWGDGIIQTVTGTGAAAGPGIPHTYAVPNPQYTITITANSNTGHAAFGFGTGGSVAGVTANKWKLLKALGHIKENTSTAAFADAYYHFFYGCTYLNEVSPDLLPAVPNGTSYIFSSMFYYCTSLASLPRTKYVRSYQVLYVCV
ncbi:hypothetical protein AGMMS49579_24960 [Spirochaetia bacterium]|nr:hypothetical protein AGMMS49579_24960 [Spirochaetia bacterium]